MHEVQLITLFLFSLSHSLSASISSSDQLQTAAEPKHTRDQHVIAGHSVAPAEVRCGVV